MRTMLPGEASVPDVGRATPRSMDILRGEGGRSRRLCMQGESACKPASVPPGGVPGWRPSIWDRRCRRPRAVHQGTRPGQPPRPRRRGRCVPYSTLLRVGFAKPAGHPAAGALLPHRFTLAGPLARAGGLFSVALSCGSPRLAVSQHPALWRPDFPRSRRTGTAAAQPAPPAGPVCHPERAQWRHTGSMVPILVIAFILVPLAELAVLIAVGDWIGLVPTLILLLVVSVCGAWLAKGEGLAAWRRLQLALAQGRMPTVEVTDGAMILLAGALLLTPGFLSDVLGILLLLPPTRAIARRPPPRRAERRLRRRTGRRVVVDGTARPAGSTRVTWGPAEVADRQPPPP